MSELNLDHLFNFDHEDITKALHESKPLAQKGRVVQAFGTMVHVSGIRARIGQQCLIKDREGSHEIVADVVGLSHGKAILLPLDNLQGVAVDSEVILLKQSSTVPFGNALLGRVLSGLGEPIDGKPLGDELQSVPLYANAPSPMKRKPIDKVVSTGIKAIDGFLTTGLGQRMGIFAMAGGGKSTLLSMLARGASADVIIIGLIGERGREVREFIEHNLGEEGLARSVIIASTSDRPAVERMRAAYAATAIAEGFRAQGKEVLLLMDSVTRFARALREIGLSVGEPAVRRGYPPSVFAELPKLFERTGNDDNGSITAFYTVLAEDDDGTDPIAEEVRSILDGHIVLSRQMAQEGHYPAIDVLSSASRVFNKIVSKDHLKAALHLRKLIAEYEKIIFLIQVGEYKEGADPVADEAVRKRELIQAYLQQDVDDMASFDLSSSTLLKVAYES